MRLFRRLLPALLLVFVAAPLAAQQVRGRVVDEGGQSVKAATVFLLDGEGRRVVGTHTDDEGAFQLRVPREGSYRLRAQRIGYGEALTDTMQVGGRVSLELTLRLSVRAVALDPLTITARQHPPRVPRLVSVGFYRRQEQGQGVHFEREDIERQRPVQMSALVSQVPGVLVMGGGSFAGDVVMMRGSQCLPSVWLDGRLARPGGRLEAEAQSEWSSTAAEARLSPFSRREVRVRHRTVAMDELISPDEVEAVEVYRGPAEVPAIFAFTAGSCGAVVVWTQFHAGLAADVR